MHAIRPATPAQLHGACATHQEHVFLVAFETEAMGSRDEARAILYEALRAAQRHVDALDPWDRPVLRWWHADADRADGSDRQLAALAPEGYQLDTADEDAGECLICQPLRD